MRIYSVQRRARSAEDDGEAVFVKEGFCWPGLLFGIFWTLWHGMWVASAALFAISFVSGAVIELVGLNDATASLVQIVLQAGVGVFGNDMRRWSLRRAGFVESAVVMAPRRTAAEYRYFAALSGGELR
jgi:hypothetical protein